MSRPEILSMPNIPKPLHGLNPRSIMGKEMWDKCRQEIYASTNYHCAACDIHKSNAKGPKWLEAHELFSIDYRTGVAKLMEIAPLCHFCHSFIHSGLLRIKARNKEVTSNHVRDVMMHGVDILRIGECKMFSGTAELCDLVNVDRSGVEISPLPRGMAEWGKWRMCWNGVEYKGKFKTMNDWAPHLLRRSAQEVPPRLRVRPLDPHTIFAEISAFR